MRKTALVIGASRGIGKEVVELLAQNDIEVYAFARSFEDRSESNVHYRKIDLTSPTVKSDFRQLISSISNIDYLINNAGHIVVKPFLELTREEIAACYDVNVIAMMEIIQCCIPKMTSGSHIVNISSMGGFQGTMKFPGLAAYSTSKAALVSLTELLAEEFKDSGISINCLCLGAVQTEMLASAFPGYQAPHSAAEMARFITDFTLNSGAYFKGKILPVSISTP